MIGSLLTRALVMLFGYAYPAYECFKTVEKNKPEIDQLIFWCQYWILVAMLTVFERIGDTFISWVPMYSEAKLAFYIYLWFPRTKGTTYVYDSFFKPYVSKHENEIDRNLMELKARAGDMVVIYFQRATSYGQTRVFEILQYIASQSTPKSQPTRPQQQAVRAQPPANPAPNHPLSTRPPQPPTNEEPPSPTSSSSSSQNQKGTEQELNSLPAASKATAPSSNPAPPATQNSPKKMISAPLRPPLRRTGLLPLNPEASSSQLTPKKPAAQESVPESSDESGENEAESMQIEPAGKKQLDKTNSLPPPEETVMEEEPTRGIATRARLRKTRSTAK